MITYAVVILLIVLITANVANYAYNKLYPPCDSLTEYFKSARLLPDGSIAGLGSIPSGTDVNYVGAQTVAVDEPGVIGLKSRNSNLVNPNQPYKHDPLVSAVNEMFLLKPEQSEGHDGGQTKKDTTMYNNTNVAMFEMEMEGLKANNNHQNPNKITTKPSGHIYERQREGYCDRDTDKW